MMSELKMIENDLVPVYETDKGIKVVYGKDLHNALEIKTDFSTWVKRRFSECDAEENKDFDLFHNFGENPLGGRPQIDYIIQLDTAKEMAMLERNEKGKQVRKYFIAIEEKYKKSEIDVSQLSPELQMFKQIFDNIAQQQLEQKRQAEKIDNISDNVRELRARVETHNEDYYTVAGYASLRGIKVDISKANMLGRKCSKLSKHYGYDIGKTRDPRFGAVNTYHVDILKEVFSAVA